MKVVILAGGQGTRLSEETVLTPKPLLEIGNKPILWHIMKIFSTYGFDDFIICCGYKGFLIKDFFLNYYLHHSDISINLRENSFKLINNNTEPWKVTLVDTGLETQTGGRLLKIKKLLKNEENFFLTYGDGVGDINIKNLLKFHKQNKTLATVTATRPQGRYGVLNLKNSNKVIDFKEKIEGNKSWINGGFFVLKPEVLNKIKNSQTKWEEEPLSTLASEGKLSAYKHNGFWHPMDTLRDKNYLNLLWKKNKAPWRIWK